jgi:hypothetical protein
MLPHILIHTMCAQDEYSVHKRLADQIKVAVRAILARFIGISGDMLKF